MDAIILCGGRGSRLAPVVSDVPKSIAPVKDRPFLDHVLDHLISQHNIERVILATGHMAEKIEAYYKYKYCGLPILYSKEDYPLGTGGAIVNAIGNHPQNKPFLILNGDTFIDFDLDSLSNILNNTVFDIAMTLFKVSDTSRFGTVNLDGNKVIGFTEKSKEIGPGFINAGVYMANPGAFTQWAECNSVASMETDILPALVGKGKVTSAISGTRFIDIGTPESFNQGQKFF